MATIVKRSPGRPADPARIAERKEQILAAAARQFGAQGYTQTDVDSVATAADTTKGTVYYYFNSKERLFLAAVDAEVRRLKNTVLDAADDAADDPIEEIKSVVVTYLRFFYANPHVVELLIEERATFKDRDKPTYFQHRDLTLPRWYACVERLIAEGRARQCDPKAVVAVLSDCLYGTIFTNYFTGAHRQPEEQAANILRVVFNGTLVQPIDVEIRDNGHEPEGD